MRTFEIEAPDGRRIRHQRASIEDARRNLIVGYRVAGEVLCADADGGGGIVVSTDAEAKSLMREMLDRYGDELLAWLATKNIVGSMVMGSGLPVEIDPGMAGKAMADRAGFENAVVRAKPGAGAR